MAKTLTVLRQCLLVNVAFVCVCSVVAYTKQETLKIPQDFDISDKTTNTKNSSLTQTVLSRSRCMTGFFFLAVPLVGHGTIHYYHGYVIFSF